MSNFRIAWLLSYISIASVSAAIVTPALPLIQQQFSLSVGAVEWMVSSFLIGYVIGQLIYGPLANRYGRLKALRIGLFINLLGIFICFLALFSHAYWLLIIGRLVSALGAASGLACTFMLINEWVPEPQRKTAMAYTTLSFALGIGVAVMLGGLFTEYWRWQGCFLFLLIHGVLMLWGTRIFSETLKKPKPIHLVTIFHDYYEALSSASLIIYSLVVGCCAVISYCFAAAGPQIAHELLKLSAAQYGYWNALNIVGTLVGGLLTKEVLNFLSIKQVITIGFLGFAAGIGSLFFMWSYNSHSTLWFFLTTAVLYLFSGFLFSGGSCIASNALDDKASAAAMMSFVNMCFATISVIVMGYLSGYLAGNDLLAFISILGCVWLLVVSLLLFLSIRKAQAPQLLD